MKPINRIEGSTHNNYNKNNKSHIIIPQNKLIQLILQKCWAAKKKKQKKNKGREQIANAPNKWKDKWNSKQIEMEWNVRRR